MREVWIEIFKILILARVAKHTDCGFTKNEQRQRYTNEGLHW